MLDIRKALMLLWIAGGDVTVLTDEERQALVKVIKEYCQDNGIELTALVEPEINLN